MSLTPDQKLIANQAEQIRELHSWLALLVVRHGEYAEPYAWRYEISPKAAQIMRDALPRTDMLVSVEYDFEKDLWQLTAM